MQCLVLSVELHLAHFPLIFAFATAIQTRFCLHNSAQVGGGEARTGDAWDCAMTVGTPLVIT